MENSEINPKDIIQPQSGTEKILSFFQKGGVTKDLVTRLSELEPVVALPGGKPREITMKDVTQYVVREAEWVAEKYPPRVTAIEVT